MKTVNFQFKKKPETEQDHACIGACKQASEKLKEYPEDGSQVQGDSNEEQLLAMHHSAAGVPRPQRFKSAPPVTNRLRRPSVWAQNTHSLPSFAAQIFTTHRQYKACYGLASKQLFKATDKSQLSCARYLDPTCMRTVPLARAVTFSFSERVPLIHFLNLYFIHALQE